MMDVLGACGKGVHSLHLTPPNTCLHPAISCRSLSNSCPSLGLMLAGIPDIVDSFC